ncbi:hypothetical protein FAM09_24300 [Niastella caeni]|uniref:Outer membrane protein beta-barrel domain-containing protein n=1 Tax=Niastella caeni TaxID=2569763 RepID=A0A4S8HGJ4_9BACT|nr:hypothetical protein [Niastella caeni]THU34147.1 hypothetical protein FAM09_24300 [Niastella caeni]
MKKTSTLLTGFLFLSIILQAQKKQSKFFTQLAVGPSFPIGRFAETSYKGENEVPGFAKTGIGAHLSLGYYLNKSFGLLLSSGYTIHEQDEQAYRDYFNGFFSGITVRQMEAKSWKTAKVMAGGFLVTPLTSESELVLRTKLTAGLAKTAVPKIWWWGADQSGMSTAGANNEKVPLPWSFCYQVSAALEYKVSRNWHVLLDISSFNTKATNEFSYTIIPNPPGGPVQMVTVKNKYKQATVNVMAGIGVSF